MGAAESPTPERSCRSPAAHFGLPGACDASTAIIGLLARQQPEHKTSMVLNVALNGKEPRDRGVFRFEMPKEQLVTRFRSSNERLR